MSNGRLVFRFSSLTTDGRVAIVVPHQPVWISFQAFEFYNRALRSLYERKTFPEVWDTVTWELSGAYFSMATLLQDYAPLSVYAQERVSSSDAGLDRWLLGVGGNSRVISPVSVMNALSC